jgi:hypothetical protein
VKTPSVTVFNSVLTLRGILIFSHWCAPQVQRTLVADAEDTLQMAQNG